MRGRVLRDDHDQEGHVAGQQHPLYHFTDQQLRRVRATIKYSVPHYSIHTHDYKRYLPSHVLREYWYHYYER